MTPPDQNGEPPEDPNICLAHLRLGIPRSPSSHPCAAASDHAVAVPPTRADYFFVNNEFVWANENVRAMITEMGPDHDNFPCDMKGIDWQQYINVMVLGIKKFLLKEDVSERGLAQSREKYANKNWRGYWIRVALMIATIRSMVTLGYLRANRMSQGSTYVMALALVSVTKRWRAILASDNITV